MDARGECGCGCGLGRSGLVWFGVEVVGRREEGERDERDERREEEVGRERRGGAGC